MNDANFKINAPIYLNAPWIMSNKRPHPHPQKVLESVKNQDTIRGVKNQGLM